MTEFHDALTMLSSVLAPAFFDVLGLAALGAPLLAFAAEAMGRAQRKAFLEKFAQHLAVMGFGLLLLALAVTDYGLFAIGGEYDWSRELTLRTGIGYEISPVDGPTTRLVQDPDSNRVWASLGASYMISASTRWDFSYSHVFFEDNAPFDRVGASTQFATPHLLGTADVRMDLFSFGFKTVWGGAETAPAALK
jgi:hypothetical protein